MMLFLHIRLVEMKICAFLLAYSLPAAWIVVGVLSLLLLVLVGLYVVKLREAAALKKEVLELRDTMRMMRYEEANLARMLHTASKPAVEPSIAVAMDDASATVSIPEEDVAAPTEEAVAAGELQEQPQGHREETTSTEQTEEQVEAQQEESEEEREQEELVKELVDTLQEPEAFPEVIEEPKFESEPETAMAPEATTEETVDEANLPDPVAEEEQPTIPHLRKQAINERRPAIPNDLFAAWFAENESLSVEGPETFEESEKTTPIPPTEEGVKTLQQEVVIAHRSESTNQVEEVPVEGVVLQETVTLPADDTPSMGSIGLNKEDERFCRKLERIVNTRMRNPNLNIDVIAAQLGLGRTNFYRKVRELTGMSPNDYLRKCRMERAAELLCTTETAVNDVCAQVGMPDAQYFSRVFKAHFGMPPSTYREQHQSISQ